MQTRDQDELQQALVDIGRQESVLRVAIFDSEGRLRLADRQGAFEARPDLGSPGCVECHRSEGMLQLRSAVIELPGQEPVLRSSVLISNEPACYKCHDSSQQKLGVLISDFSLRHLEHNTAAELQRNLGLSGILTVLITAGVYGLVHTLVVHRVERFQRPLRHFAHGDFSERVPVEPVERDELGQLASAVNRMAEDLEQQADLKRRADLARHQAVVEERQRLARELHDGLAQVLAYVTTKTAAMHLMLRRGQNDEAAELLRQLEKAVQGLFTEVRQAILDLKLSAQRECGLSQALSECLARFQEQSGIRADLELDGDCDRLRLTGDRQAQILRIVQEALANVRKHAAASRAWVQVEPNGGQTATIVVGDDGQGFDPRALGPGSKLHFGLTTMLERAESIGARLSVDSQPGAGTRVTLTFPVLSQEADSP
jgi:signal transduction histidine kinase